ncbi:hypothetical protein [Couchioplanes caeruleus]|uniref:Uncharacterized protein n=2 Tax=Couchioplanes caeruleus TaxID=56438 RepID=A0A1K0GQ54_9ACTN|nr:hypothetical protein [Couchioplanes caeruleus]OJF14542.1 hypothetical protein BG844_09430 [Couchioplanes caeruleus subsp. caeruleus]ROP21297.1 hypothetical protein EDD30_7696 [Couchioplanes caeruleus]
MSWADLTTFAYDYAVPLLAGTGVLGLVLLLVMIVRVKRSGRPLRPIALSASMNLALMLNAEGMWYIAIDTLRLPALFAVLVFAVFEICFLTATSLAAEQYRNTTVYGPDGKVITPGHPGSMLYVAALIALMSGVVVASGAPTTTEKILRLAIPVMIFLMWWAALTAAGQRARRSRFAHSPMRIAERRGWFIPDEDPDLAKMIADRRLTKMAMLAHRLHNGELDEKRKVKVKTELARLSLTATDDDLAEVQRRVNRAGQAEQLTQPGVLAALMPTPTVAAAVTPSAVAPAAPALAQPQPTPQEEPAAVSGHRPRAADDAARGEKSTASEKRAAEPAVPSTAKYYAQWLTVWLTMTAEPTATNQILRQRTGIALRTLSKIRTAGKDGLLTAQRLQELRMQEGAAASADTGTRAVRDNADEPAPAAVPSQPSRSRESGTAPEPAAAAAGGHSTREPAMAR